MYVCMHVDKNAEVTQLHYFRVYIANASASVIHIHSYDALVIIRITCRETSR